MQRDSDSSICAPLRAYLDQPMMKEGVVQLTTQVHDTWNKVQKIHPRNLVSKSTNHQMMFFKKFHPKSTYQASIHSNRG
jgi:hypothetical protein